MRQLRGFVARLGWGPLYCPNHNKMGPAKAPDPAQVMTNQVTTIKSPRPSPPNQGDGDPARISNPAHFECGSINPRIDTADLRIFRGFQVLLRGRGQAVRLDKPAFCRVKAWSVWAFRDPEQLQLNRPATCATMHHHAPSHPKQPSQRHRNTIATNRFGDHTLIVPRKFL